MYIIIYIKTIFLMYAKNAGELLNICDCEGHLLCCAGGSIGASDAIRINRLNLSLDTNWRRLIQ